MGAMVYRVIADVTMVAHFAFLVYLTLGGFLAWIWPRAILPHIAIVAWGIATVTMSFQCPLTYVENYFRELGGRTELDGGFIDTYLTGVVYPADDVVLARVAVGILVGVSWFGAYMRWRTKRGSKSGHAAK